MMGVLQGGDGSVSLSEHIIEELRNTACVSWGYFSRCVVLTEIKSVNNGERDAIRR